MEKAELRKQKKSEYNKKYYSKNKDRLKQPLQEKEQEIKPSFKPQTAEIKENEELSTENLRSMIQQEIQKNGLTPKGGGSIDYSIFTPILLSVLSRLAPLVLSYVMPSEELNKKSKQQSEKSGADIPDLHVTFM
jgi:hypothetical protein